jgi:hypothetical protein
MADNPVIRFTALVTEQIRSGDSLTIAVGSVKRANPQLALEVLEIIGGWPSSERELRELQRQGP